MKKFAFTILGAGVLLTVVFAAADSIGLGGDRGMGAAQLLGIQAGVVLMLLGTGLLSLKWDVKAASLPKLRLTDILNIPTLYWVLGTFLFTYIIFFLLPVFFSGHQIHYLTKYIPDAYITHIGFDIEAIVSRIETWLKTGQSPYTDGFIAYPPLTIAIFSAFSLVGYPTYYSLMVSVSVLAYLLSVLVIPALIIPKHQQTLWMLFFITGIFSYGFQFEQERGQFNLLAFAFCLSAIYLFHYQPRFRYFAYLLFSLAIQLKVYPVFFVFMFVDDWKDWQTIIKRFAGLGLFNFALLFVLGNSLFSDFVHAITGYQFLESSRYENLSIKGFAYYLSHDRIGISMGSAESLFWLALGGCFLAVIGYAFSHKIRGLNPYLFMVSTIAALIIPSVSNDYKLTILIAPMLLLFSGLPETGGRQKTGWSTLLVTLTALAYWITLFPATVKPEWLSRNFSALMVILFSITILNFLAPYSYERDAQKISNPPEPEL